MQLNPLRIVTKFAPALQQKLFPELQPTVGPMSKELKLVNSVAPMAPLELLLSAKRASTGRPAKDRAALATAFTAKAVLNLPATRYTSFRLFATIVDSCRLQTASPATGSAGYP